jgi:hypothetical protein
MAPEIESIEAQLMPPAARTPATFYVTALDSNSPPAMNDQSNFERGLLRPSSFDTVFANHNPRITSGERCRPLLEGLVGGQHNGAAFVALADDLEEKVCAVLVDGQIA